MTKEIRELRMDELDSVSGGDFLGGLSSLVQLAAAALEGAKESTITSTPVVRQTLGAAYSPANVGQTRIADRLR
jgi:hypothetical protein